MSTFSPTVSWHLKPGEKFDPDSYHRDHEWTFPGGEVVLAFDRHGADTQVGGPDLRPFPSPVRNQGMKVISRPFDVSRTAGC